MVLINIKDKATKLAKKIKGFFKKEKTEDVKEVLKQANLWIPEHAVQEYRDTGGIPMRAGKYTKTFLKWYDDNY